MTPFFAILKSPYKRHWYIIMLNILKWAALSLVLVSCQNTLISTAASEDQSVISSSQEIQAPSQLTAEVLSPTQIKLQWQRQPNHKQFTVYLNDAIIASQITDTHYLLQNLSPLSSYSVKVEAQLDNKKSSPKSEALMLTTPYTTSAAVEKLKATEQRLLAVEIYADGVVALSASKQMDTLSNPDGTLFYASDLFIFNASSKPAAIHKPN